MKPRPMPVADIPIDGSNAEAVIAVRAAIAAIEQQFGREDPDSHRVVTQLRLLARVMEQGTRVCKRCITPFRLAIAAVLWSFRKNVALPWYCGSCRALRRDERNRRASVPLARQHHHD